MDRKDCKHIFFWYWGHIWSSLSATIYIYAVSHFFPSIDPAPKNPWELLQDCRLPLLHEILAKMPPYTLYPISQMPKHVRQPLINLSQEDFLFPKIGNTLEHQTSNIFQSSGQKGIWKSVRAPSEGLCEWTSKIRTIETSPLTRWVKRDWAFPSYFFWILWPKNFLSTR